MLTVDISTSLVISRVRRTDPWRVVKAGHARFFGAYLVAFAKGLRREEQRGLVIDDAVLPQNRAMYEAALTKAGIERP